MNSCAVKKHVGNIFHLETGNAILNGWYSDEQLPEIFKNTLQYEL